MGEGSSGQAESPSDRRPVRPYFLPVFDYMGLVAGRIDYVTILAHTRG
ncbi:MAG: hypothetical protein RPU61_01030 [Candidatus Sedimenticola sp. (ex Thyasira tokunagai)]